MKAIFICKPATLEDVKTVSAMRKELHILPQEYTVIEERKVSTGEWDDLTRSFLEDRAWVSEFTGRLTAMPDIDWSKRNCIKVTCRGKGSLLIDPQGYDYARYVGIAK